MHVCRFNRCIYLGLVLPLLLCGTTLRAKTVALWLFDEPAAAYPSTVLNDAGSHEHVLFLGRGGCLAEGRFGNALAPIEPPPLQISGRLSAIGKLETGLGQFDPEARSPARLFGLVSLPKAPGRTVPPMTWQNATFAALTTLGEKHLRSGVLPNVSDSHLNLGNFDWTVEFWFLPTGREEGVLFELGRGPRGDSDQVTRLTVDPAHARFVRSNRPADVTCAIPTSASALSSGWHHYAFVYDGAAGKLRHYVDGAPQGQAFACRMQSLDVGDEAYFSVGRDGTWQQPLPGRLDELHFADHQVYRDAFATPGSRSLTYSGRLPVVPLAAGLPLLFAEDAKPPFNLGKRKHLFLDDALIEKAENVVFVPQPPQRVAQVLDNIKGHLTVVDDEQGVLRVYYQGPDDTLAVMTSRDGLHWEKPDLGRTLHGERNIVCDSQVGLGTVFIDPNAAPDQRWKYVSGVRRKGIFVFTSADGWWFEPHETAALPFSAGSQSAIYYDDQRQVYVGHHRSDYGATPQGSTERRFVMSETKELLRPWPFIPTTPERTRQANQSMRTHADVLDPWFLDNGPLAPCGFGIELPTVIGRDAKIDPEATDIYVTKAQKYPAAPDAYIAFPTVYFHYWDSGPATRELLGKKERGRGSGVTEVQMAVSRDGHTWKRYPRPAYTPIGGSGRNDIHMLFMAHGIVERGDEIWQFVTGHGGNGIGYHSAWQKGSPSPLWKLVQRKDGFVAAEGAYTGATIKTKPLRFEGGRLHLNVDTGATGSLQVGICGEDGQFLPGYGLDDCVYINGDFLDEIVEWSDKGHDCASLQGKVVQLVFRMLGTKLFAMQFK
ncbi:MAG: LamG domain-containing protein, partial [Singulisphaera sp.]